LKADLRGILLLLLNPLTGPILVLSLPLLAPLLLLAAAGPPAETRNLEEWVIEEDERGRIHITVHRRVRRGAAE